MDGRRASRIKASIKVLEGDGTGAKAATRRRWKEKCGAVTGVWYECIGLLGEGETKKVKVEKKEEEDEKKMQPEKEGI